VEAPVPGGEAGAGSWALGPRGAQNRSAWPLEAVASPCILLPVPAAGTEFQQRGCREPWAARWGPAPGVCSSSWSSPTVWRVEFGHTQSLTPPVEHQAAGFSSLPPFPPG